MRINFKSVVINCKDNAWYYNDGQLKITDKCYLIDSEDKRYIFERRNVIFIEIEERLEN